MKISADKVDSRPPHALSVQDVRHILAAVPPEWIEGLKSVRLSNSMECSPGAFFSRYDGSLTIYSRCGTTTKAVVAVLSELAAGSLGMNTRNRHRRSQAEEHRLQQYIQPLVDQLLPVTTPKKHFGHKASGPFHPVSFTDENR